MKTNHYIRLTAITLLVFTGLLASCSKKTEQGAIENKQSELIDLSLDVDTALLGESLEIAGLKLSLPKDWAPVIENVIEMMKTHAEKDTGTLSMVPEYAYSTESGCVLVISRFRKLDQSDKDFTDWAMEVGHSYVRARDEKNMNLNWIAVNGLEAFKVVTKDERTVHIKVLVNGDDPVSIDYTIPLMVWPSQKAVIGSSLGSIKRL